MNAIKKCVITLNIGDYAPEICAITYPLMRFYAHKIGADFKVITERKCPDMPVTYEKLQVAELCRGYDWSIYFDSDALIHPETIDFTTQLNKSEVLHNACDMANVRWRYDRYFLRDGRNIGSCNWFAIASDWTRDDLYAPLDISLAEALDNIFPIPYERKVGIDREHLIDDYTLSRNIARFGLKFRKALDIQHETGMPSANFFYHEYTIPVDEKVIRLREMTKKWFG